MIIYIIAITTISVAFFTIPELFALKQFMYKYDVRRMLQMAHQRYEQTGLEQWNHDEKW